MALGAPRGCQSSTRTGLPQGYPALLSPRRVDTPQHQTPGVATASAGPAPCPCPCPRQDPRLLGAPGDPITEWELGDGTQRPPSTCPSQRRGRAWKWPRAAEPRGTDEAGPTPGPEGSSAVRTHTPGLGPSQHPKQLRPLTPYQKPQGSEQGSSHSQETAPDSPSSKDHRQQTSLLGPAHSTGPAEPSPGQTPRPPDGSSGHVAAAPTTSQTLTTPVPDRAPRLWYTARCGGAPGQSMEITHSDVRGGPKPPRARPRREASSGQQSPTAVGRASGPPPSFRPAWRGRLSQGASRPSQGCQPHAGTSLPPPGLP